LESRFESGGVGKEYLCLLAGRLPENEGVIYSPLPGRESSEVPAMTRFKVEKRFSDTTLARVRIETGRMHQIRLHFAKLGYPVVMDDQHGDFVFNKRFRKEIGLKRQFLHAASLTLDYGGKKRTWTAQLPSDLARTLELIGANKQRRQTGS
jgi:23S rRNA pseudouridine955/2504/2580 synthase